MGLNPTFAAQEEIVAQRNQPNGIVGLDSLGGASVQSLYVSHPSYSQVVWFVGATAQYAFYTSAGTSLMLYDYTLGGNVLSIDRTRCTIASPLAAKAISKSSDPTTSDIASGYWGVVKNTTSGEVRLWYNDNGTMKKSAVLS